MRTLFEEGWGEINHAVVYPYYQNDEILKEYTELLNRLSGLADEMSSFFNRLKKLEIKVLKNIELDNNNVIKNETEKIENLQTTDEKMEKGSRNNIKSMCTPYDCLQLVLDE